MTKQVSHKVTRWDCLLFDSYSNDCFWARAVYIDGKPMAAIDKETMQRAMEKRRVKEQEAN